MKKIYIDLVFQPKYYVIFITTPHVTYRREENIKATYILTVVSYGNEKHLNFSNISIFVFNIFHGRISRFIYFISPS